MCLSTNLILCLFVFRFVSLGRFSLSKGSFVRWLGEEVVDFGEMENRKAIGDSSASSFDHLFGPKDSSSYSSSGVFGSIFSPPSTVHGRDSAHAGIMGSHYHGGNGKDGSPGNTADYKKGESSGTARSSVNQNETTEPCYFSSSIYYGGQENYSSTKKTTESPQFFKKDGGDDDPNGSNSNSASRGNWWQGSLYY